MERTSLRRLSWQQSDRVYLTLDLECDYGTALGTNTYQALDHVPRLVTLLESLDVPLTCFVQTEVLDERPEAVEALRDAGTTVTFHPHSHTHRPRSVTDVPAEVETATDRFRSFFDRDPTGYRFPNGSVEPADYAVLGDQGYEFDASVLPTWRPGHFDNRGKPMCPTYHPAFDLVEIPFTVLSRFAPIPTSLSFCRLFGSPYLAAQGLFPSRPTVFNVHMHDLVTPRHTDLPLPYRLAYSRNDRGFEIFEHVLETFECNAFAFDTLDALTATLYENIPGG
jgi:peptidoglycan/xylan/chitin deacetylase (PgdA/CDA1 family)